ncbi:MAG: hypothetical protein GX977_13270 [Firmicutes bacterium]|nr:hypothetical protein [Bacillota bacterium]
MKRWRMRWKGMIFRQAMWPKLAASLSTSLGGAITALDSLDRQAVYLIVNYFCVPLFLLTPLMLSSTITAHSFAGEKGRKTLESWLVFPIDILTLFARKVLSAFLPAMAITAALDQIDQALDCHLLSHRFLRLSNCCQRYIQSSTA